MTTPGQDPPPPPYAGSPAGAAAVPPAHGVPTSHPAPPAYGAPPAYPAPPAKPPKPPLRAWDLVVTIVLLVLDTILAAIASFMAVFLVMASDPCGSRVCNEDLIVLGWLMGMFLPWVVLVVALIVAIVLLVKRRLAFWVPLVGAVAIVLSLAVAFAVTAAGVPGTSL